MNSRGIFNMFSRSRGGAPATRIFVRGLEIEASIGVYPHEHESTQPIIVDVEIDIGDTPPPKDDRLHETVDYETVSIKAAEIAKAEHVQLVETLAQRIADWCLSSDPRVVACAVRIAKPQALKNADVAGVEIVRRR